MFKKYQHIHFVGIGGIGMSGIAQVLLNLGYRVSGSDLKSSAMTKMLKKRGARIVVGHEKSHVQDAHVVVISSAVSPTNPEVLAATRQGIPVIGRAEMLAELMRLKYAVAIGGTHGKTTTTSMIGQVLTHAGLDPTLIIGGRVNNLKSNARLGRSDYMVAEADESDRSFLKLTPTIAVITNVDPEHMENYKNLRHLKESFISFANKVPFYGAVIACQDHRRVRELFPKIERRLITYGLKPGAEYTATGIVQEEAKMSFTVVHQGTPVGRTFIRLPGHHHVGNALATVAACRQFDVPFAKILKGLSTFKGIQRRFEILARRKDGLLVVDDYAHHPAELLATLRAAGKGWPKHKCVVVMQPHRYTRLQNLFEDFVAVLQKADTLVLLPVYPAGEKPIAGVSALRLLERLRAAKKTEGLYYAEDEKDLNVILKGLVAEKTMFLFLGAGNITSFAQHFAKEMRKGA